MAEIKEAKVEKGGIEEIFLTNQVTLTKVYFGEEKEDFIVISGNDMGMAKRLLKTKNQFETALKELGEKEKEIRDKYKDEKDGEISDSHVDDIYELHKEFANASEKIIDGFFGDGKTRSFFADVYEVLPDFVPSPGSLKGIFDGLASVIERAVEHEKKLEQEESFERMSKYKPQDHKRKAK